MKLLQLLLEDNYKFCSAQVDIPEPLRSQILAWSKNNIDSNLLYIDDDTKGLEDDPHVTVLYGLHDDDPKAVQDCIGGSGPFDITLGKISKFSADNYDVLKLDINSSGIRSLNKKLKTLPYTTNYPTYVPHSTLAYVKKNTCDALLDLLPIEQTFKVSQVSFSNRDGDKTIVKL